MLNSSHGHDPADVRYGVWPWSKPATACSCCPETRPYRSQPQGTRRVQGLRTCCSRRAWRSWCALSCESSRSSSAPINSSRFCTLLVASTRSCERQELAGSATRHCMLNTRWLSVEMSCRYLGLRTSIARVRPCKHAIIGMRVVTTDKKHMRQMLVNGPAGIYTAACLLPASPAPVRWVCTPCCHPPASQAPAAQQHGHEAAWTATGTVDGPHKLPPADCPHATQRAFRTILFSVCCCVNFCRASWFFATSARAACSVQLYAVTKGLLRCATRHRGIAIPFCVVA